MSHNYPEIDPLDWSTVQPHVDRLLVAELKPTAVRAWMQDWSDLFAVLNETEFQIYREITENTADEEADARFKQYVQVIHPEQAKAEQALKKKLLSVEGYEPTSETALIFKRFQAEADLFREENIPIQTELALLGKQYDEITGGLSFEWEGESKTIPEVELLLSDRDRSTREKAWRLAQDAYLAKREELNELFLKMLASASSNGEKRRIQRLSRLSVAGHGASSATRPKTLSLSTTPSSMRLSPWQLKSTKPPPSNWGWSNYAPGRRIFQALRA